MGIKITDMTLVTTDISGDELIVMTESDNTTKATNIATLSDAAIAELAAVGTTSTIDGYVLLENGAGAFERATVANIVSNVQDTMFGETVADALGDTDVLVLRQSGTDKKVELSEIVSYCSADIESGLLNLSGLGQITESLATDKVLVARGITPYYENFSDMAANVLGSLYSVIDGYNEPGALASGDMFYVINNSNSKKVSLADIAEYVASSDTGYTDSDKVNAMFGVF